ncbi:hypothetical protein [Atopococcus tabaci]|uniref:hypothetical protein n=1 Tax=Atopococcus tabaci TaxID=269774 RepID=UPI00240A8353|nr:hypothetical protein [Atopococcus tabaci]
MRKLEYGKLFKFTRGVVRLAVPRYQAASLPESEEPIVYVAHHQNMKGPVTVLAWLTQPVRTWVFSVFLDQKECFNHYMDYTFTQRFGWPRALAKLVVWPLSFFITDLMKSGKAIPVYRKSKKVMHTMKLSVEALQKGENILVFPDVDYQSDSEEVGEIYEGFLFVEKYYHRKTGKHVAFVPLYADSHTQTIRAGEIIRFKEEASFVEQRAEVAEQIQAELNRLADLSAASNPAAGTPFN